VYLLHTAARFCFVLAATGAGWAVYYCVIIEGWEGNTTTWSLLSQELRISAGNIPSHCHKNTQV